MEDQNNINVRTATTEDLDALMQIAMEACIDNALAPPSPERLLADIWPAVNLQGGIIGIVGPIGGRIEGVILLRIGKMWYSDEDCLEERSIFVRPEYRAAKGGRARKLCQFAKDAADKLGLPLSIGVLSDERTEAKMRLYERIFGKPKGVYFVYNGMKTGDWAKAAS